jgi:P pilus assembly chaperone PapD
MKQFLILLIIFSASNISLLFANMQIFPVRAHITPENNTTSLTIRNKDTVRSQYVINAVYFEQTSKGQLQEQKENEKISNSAIEILKFSPRKFSLAPEAEQIIRVMAKKDKRLQPGDYRAHMRFTTEEEPTETKDEETTKVAFNLKAKIAVSIPVLLRIEPFEKKLELKNFAIDTNTKKISVDLIRVSKNYFPYGKLEVYAKKGSKKIAITQIQGVQCFNDKLTFTFDYESMPSQISPQEEITLEYIDTFADKEVSIATTSIKLQ